MSSKILTSLFGQKRWANGELFDVVATAADAPEHAEAVHTAVRLLNHIYVVDRIFQAHLLSEQHEYEATNTTQTPSLSALHFAVAETDAWFEKYVTDIGEGVLSEPISFTFTDGDRGTMTRLEMLFHVITHGAYHRGNVGQVLKGISVAPPRDLFTKFLHGREPSRRDA